VQSLAFDPAGRRLAIGAGDALARVWTFDAAGPPRTFSHADDDAFGDLSIGHVAFSPDGGRLVSTSSTWLAARVWDLASGTRGAHFDYGFGLGAPCATWFTPDGRHLITGKGGSIVRAESGIVALSLTMQRERARFWDFRTQAGLTWTADGGALVVTEAAAGRVLTNLATRR
jgi:WD40 repeat protein